MTNPYATIPLNQPNRDELIRVLEHIRVNEPETFERNVRECGAVVPAPKHTYDSAISEWGNVLYSYWPEMINVYTIKNIAIFRIKTRKP